jgi:hypothetical protein
LEALVAGGFVRENVRGCIQRETPVPP